MKQKGIKNMKTKNRIDALKKNITAWPSWFADEAALQKHVEARLGVDAYLDTQKGWASGGLISMFGSEQRFRIAIFVRPAEHGGWQSTDRMLVAVEK
jgi:hypothetical protein